MGYEIEHKGDEAYGLTRTVGRWKMRKMHFDDAVPLAYIIQLLIAAELLHHQREADLPEPAYP